MVNKKILGWAGSATLVGLTAAAALMYAGNGEEGKKINKPAVTKEINEEKTETKAKVDETESNIEKLIAEAGYKDIVFTINDYVKEGYITEDALKSIKERIDEIKGHPSIADGIVNEDAQKYIDNMKNLYTSLEKDFYQNAEVELGIMIHLNYDGKEEGIGSEKGNRISINGVKLKDLKEALEEKDYKAILENSLEEMPEVRRTRDMPGITITFEELVKLSEKGEYTSESRDFNKKYLSNLKDGNNGNYEMISATSTVIGEPTRKLMEGYLKTLAKKE
ncbi:hypothetical protein GF361_03365 [Candidatus Woesearchaeota archaeon]|nr:hypothetical protein [Candidatus Woesearchaeota archaeon]